LDRRWEQVWPDGLGIPDSNIPNRDPLAFIPETEAPAARGNLPPELVRLMHVPARFEPLDPRAPLEVWRRPDKARLIAGLAELINRADLGALDDGLYARRGDAPGRKLTLPCRVSRKDGGARVAFTCVGQGARLAGGFSRRGGTVQGRLDEIVLPESVAPNAIELPGTMAQTDVARFTPRRAGLHARLADGSLIDQLEISMDKDASGDATLTVRSDFAGVTAALGQLPKEAAADGPFQSQTMMAALSRVLGLPWQESARPKLPPPQALPEPASSTNSAAGRFRRYCGQCHDTTERFPPNFLHGDEAQAEGRINHCAERIFYRLSMWPVAEPRRGKTPMPPLAALSTHGFDAASWTRAPELAALRAHAERIVAASSQDPRLLLSRPYESLRSCLAAER
jgi:hypothetical protein